MGQLLVRGLNDKVIEALKQRAQMAGRSVEAEHRAILEAALPVATETFLEMAARVRGNGPVSGTPAHELIRADRDRNWKMEGWDAED